MWHWQFLPLLAECGLRLTTMIHRQRTLSGNDRGRTFGMTDVLKLMERVKKNLHNFTTIHLTSFSMIHSILNFFQLAIFFLHFIAGDIKSMFRITQVPVIEQKISNRIYHFYCCFIYFCAAINSALVRLSSSEMLAFACISL